MVNYLDIFLHDANASYSHSSFSPFLKRSPNNGLGLMSVRGPDLNYRRTPIFHPPNAANSEWRDVTSRDSGDKLCFLK